MEENEFDDELNDAAAGIIVDDIEAEIEELQKQIREFKGHYKRRFSILDRNRDGIVDIDDLGHMFIRYEFIIASGVALTLLPLFNVFGWTMIDSDFFWALAGFTLTIEGAIELYFTRKIFNILQVKSILYSNCLD